MATPPVPVLVGCLYSTGGYHPKRATDSGTAQYGEGDHVEQQRNVSQLRQPGSGDNPQLRVQQRPSGHALAPHSHPFHNVLMGHNTPSQRHPRLARIPLLSVQPWLPGKFTVQRLLQEVRAPVPITGDGRITLLLCWTALPRWVSTWDCKELPVSSEI